MNFSKEQSLDADPKAIKLINFTTISYIHYKINIK